jgi:DNA polymerase-1
MIEEQIRIEEKRNKVERQLQYQRFKNKTTQVNRLCRDSENQPVKQPIISLVKERYIPRMRELAKVEFNGVTVDRKYLEEADALLDKAIKQAEEAIYKMAGERFNINSGKQLARFINENGCGFTPPETFLQEDENTKETKTINGFENALEKCTKYPDKVFWDGQRLRYKAVALTKTGQVQLTDKILKTYKQLYDCPLSNLLLAYKKAHKAKNTFLGNADLLSILDGCLHTNYFLHGTGTGRLSSSDLNMQNIPKGKLGGVICKKLFIPRYLDYVFVNADAKGAEVGIFSGYSGDAKLTEALLGGLDAHCFFSATVLNPDKVAGGLTGEARKHALAKAGIDDDHAWSYEDFLLGKDDLHPDKVYGKRLKKLRDNIKRVVFGILYGAKSRKIAEIAGIDEAFAQTIIDLLFTMFPTIPDFVALTTWELHTFGFVETYHGRQRRFPLDNAPGRSISQAERRALNFKVQATNSDIVLDTLVEIAPIIENDLKGKILLTVHDSIGFEVPKKYVPDLVTLFKVHGTEMTRKRNPWLPVPYKWDIECGPSYGETIPIKKYLELHKDEIDKLLTPSKELYEGFTIEEMYTELREAVLEPGS